MWLTRLAVFRPVVALTVTLALVLFGIVSYFSLGLEQNPQLNLPIVTVQVVYPGASAETVEEQVTRRDRGRHRRPRQHQDADVDLADGPGDRSPSSSSEGVDVDVAASDVQQRVSGVRRDLPAEAEEPSYVKLDFNDIPVLVPGRDRHRRGRPGRSCTASPTTSSARAWRPSHGVGRVVVVGGQEPEVQVEVLPDRLRAYGLTIDDVTNAVREPVHEHLRRRGQDRQRRRHARRISLQHRLARGRPGRARRDPGHRAGRLQHRAAQRRAASTSAARRPSSSLRVNGQPAAGLLVYKQSSANITQTVDAVPPAGRADQRRAAARLPAARWPSTRARRPPDRATASRTS